MGGETSGHFYFPENFGYDDAIFASLKVAELLIQENLSIIQQEIPTYITADEHRVSCPDEKKFQVVATLQQTFREQGHQVTDIDGARVKMDGGWFIIRASNTEPKLVVRWEATNQDTFQEIHQLVKDSLEQVGVTL